MRRPLKALDPKRAGELQIRATEELKAAPQVAAVEAALRDKNLRRARTELDQVWPESVEYPRLKQKYATVEGQVTAALVARLEHALSPSCNEYNALLAKERAAQPSRIIADVTRQVTCTPLSLAQCDARALAEQGRQLHAAGRLVPAVASYESAWSCKQETQTAKRGLIIACNIPDLQRARVFWKRLSAAARKSVVASCENNHITEQQLDAL